MRPTRIERLSEEFREEIAMIIHRELKDPHLGFVTITGVELSSDLRHAKVAFSCLGNEQDRLRSQEVLDRSARYIYGLLKKRFRLKAIPELVFRHDDSIAGAIAISETLDHIKEQSPGGSSSRATE